VIEVDLPDVTTREEIFRIHLRGCPVERAVDPKELARAGEGRSGADIESICRQAVTLAVREFIECYGEKANEMADRCVVRKEHIERVMRESDRRRNKEAAA
jgi:transitional endoplasmic reticulum ATPase